MPLPSPIPHPSGGRAVGLAGGAGFGSSADVTFSDSPFFGGSCPDRSSILSRSSLVMHSSRLRGFNLGQQQPGDPLDFRFELLLLVGQVGGVSFEPELR